MQNIDIKGRVLTELAKEPDGQRKELLRLQYLKIRWMELHGADVIPVNTPMRHIVTNRARW